MLATAAPGYQRRVRLLEALLTLSRSECGRLRRELVDLAADIPPTSPQHKLGGSVATSRNSDDCNQCGPGPNTTPAERAQQAANALHHSQQRAQGMTNCFDASTGPSGGPAFENDGLGSDPGNPMIQAAQKTWPGIVPGST